MNAKLADRAVEREGIQRLSPSGNYLLRIASSRRSAASSSFLNSSATFGIVSTSRLIFEPKQSIFEYTSIRPHDAYLAGRRTRPPHERETGVYRSKLRSPSARSIASAA